MTRRKTPACSTWPRTNASKLAKREYGLLVVKGETDRRASNGAIIWLCKCKCGREALVATHNLTSGNTESCGCEQRRKTREYYKRLRRRGDEVG